MAVSDYILCSICECKIVYDGKRKRREHLINLYGTEDLTCPSCVDDLLRQIERKNCDIAMKMNEISLLQAKFMLKEKVNQHPRVDNNAFLTPPNLSINSKF